MKLSADVQEMEFKLEEGRLSFEENLKRAEEDITKRDISIAEGLEKYKELEEVCKCLRETILAKENVVLEREAVMARQRETIEYLEKEVAELRFICGDSSANFHKKSVLEYTEAEMAEVYALLEKERTNNEIHRNQIAFLENETEQAMSVTRSFGSIQKALTGKDILLKEARDDIADRERLQQKTLEDLYDANIELINTKETLANVSRELSTVKDELNAKEKELDDHQAERDLQEVDLIEVNTKYQLLEAIKETIESELTVAKEQLEEAYGEIKKLKGFSAQLQQENENMAEVLRTQKKPSREWKVLKNDQDEVDVFEIPVNDEANLSLQFENKLKSENQRLTTRLQSLQQNFYQLSNENVQLKASCDDLQTLNETIVLKNDELEQEVEKLEGQSLRKEEKIRQALVSNVNLRYTLDEYIAQSQDQIRHLKNHEREIATLTKHIQEMDELVQGLKAALIEAAEMEMKEESYTRNDKNAAVANRFRTIGTESEACGTQEFCVNAGESVSGEKIWQSELNVGNASCIKDIDSQNATESQKTSVAQPSDSNKNDVEKNYDLGFFLMMKTFQQKLQAAKIKKNVVLLLVFLGLVFCLGCTDNSVISRKYLLAFANSFMTLIFFALWLNESDKNKKCKALRARYGGNGQIYDGDVCCENCGRSAGALGDEFRQNEKIKSSFQELHEKFLEAMEKSNNDTLPIQELYEKYEKLIEVVEVIRNETLTKDFMNTVTDAAKVSDDNRRFPENWQNVAAIFGKAFVITLLCEVLYIRGIYFLPYLVNLISFVVSLITFSYFYDTIPVDSTKCAQPRTTSRDTVLEHEIEELNHIIDKEHNLVTTQREAIKVLEKRLRKEFEKRIKQRNVLLKKLKYKGKLEDLRDLLDNKDISEDDGVGIFSGI